MAKPIKLKTHNSTWCEFSNPVDLGGGDYEYSEMLCDDPANLELIENETTGAEFYLDKTFSYGDFFVMFPLTILILCGIVKIIWDKFVKE